MARLLTLLTDFGLEDGYVGAVKGVLLSAAPDATLVDVSHHVPRGDVVAGAFVLAQAAPYYPPGTVHLAVVDPGVGSTRRALAVELSRHFFVLPDNGLLSEMLLRGEVGHAHAIEDPRFHPATASPVFHGRDVFAPAAAHLAKGGEMGELGPAVAPASLVRIERPAPRREGDAWLVTVLHVDRFGNLITNLELPGDVRGGRARVGRHQVAFARTYSAVAPGEVLALRGSSGLLEIARRDGSAAALLGLGRGDVVEWRALERV